MKLKVTVEEYYTLLDALQSSAAHTKVSIDSGLTKVAREFLREHVEKCLALREKLIDQG
jgi:hypothetical protein